MVPSARLDVRSRVPFEQPPSRIGHDYVGFSIERVTVSGLEAYDYRSQGERHYLALHDMMFSDAELSIEGFGARHDLDIRNTVTFVPRGREIVGWAKPARPQNSFLAVHYDPGALRDDLGHRYDAVDPLPFVHRTDAQITSTLLKLQALLRDDAADDLHAESLCLLSAVEVFGVLADPGGRLSDRQVALVREYVEAHLHASISLAEMATVANLSRFHFSRAFKLATGQSPTAYVRARRIERSKLLLADGKLPMDAVAAAVGFNGAAQFRRVFRDVVGMPPQKFRTTSR